MKILVSALVMSPRTVAKDGLLILANQNADFSVFFRKNEIQEFFPSLYYSGIYKLLDLSSSRGWGKWGKLLLCFAE